jgi:nucleotidyltransferase/DNA polymerase involved in DNA repair
VETFLEDVDIGKIWGIGPATAQELRGQGIKTALDLYQKEEAWVRMFLHKHTREIWHELRGKKIFSVHTESEVPKSIQATRTFTPPSMDRDFLYSELSKNVENACASMRQEGLAARKAYYFLKTQEFRYHRQELIFDNPVSAPSEILKGIESTFSQVWKPRVPYRTTGITLAGLVPCGLVQEDLFGSRAASDKWSEVLKTVDKADKKYGSHTLVLASSLRAFQRRGGAVEKRLNIPYMGEVN